jgi:hypothetical protein
MLLRKRIKGEIMANRTAVEALLRERKLDRTLTSAAVAPVAAAPVGVAALDAVLNGGVPRGQVSEIVGPVSAGRTSLACQMLAAAAARHEPVALIDTFDRFDPETAATLGLDLSQLLWVRGQAVSKTAGAIDPAWMPGVRAVSGPGTLLERTIDRALKALNLVVQSGVCTIVVLDLADVPAAGVSRIPASTWLRVQRIIEGSEMAVVLLGCTPISRSPGGWTIQTATGSRQPAAGELPAANDRLPAANGQSPTATWRGSHDRSRRLAGLSSFIRATSPRRSTTGQCALVFGTRLIDERTLAP